MFSISSPVKVRRSLLCFSRPWMKLAISGAGIVLACLRPVLVLGVGLGDAADHIGELAFRDVAVGNGQVGVLGLDLIEHALPGRLGGVGLTRPPVGRMISTRGGSPGTGRMVTL